MGQVHVPLSRHSEREHNMNFHLLDNYLDLLNEEYGVPALEIIVTKDHETVYHHMCGHSDPEGCVPVSEKDFYLLFSCTKVVTMTAVMQLIEAGKVSLYDPVSRFLPEWEHMTVMNAYWKERGMFFSPHIDEPSHYAKNRIRIIDCMSMMAGLSYDLESDAIKELLAEKPEAATREVIAAISRMPLLYEPGTRYQYSLGHDVIGAVIEVVSGERFSEYLDNHIFKPLGITDLTCHPTEEQLARMSALYECDPKTKQMHYQPDAHNSYQLTKNYESGGAQLAGTAEAYSAVIEALANGGVGRNGARILRPESVMRFTHSVTTGEALRDFREGRNYEYGYGLGVRVKTGDYLGYSPVGEFGWDGAAGGYALIDPFNRVSIFYVQHIRYFLEAYTVIHPRVRDLVYKGLAR